MDMSLSKLREMGKGREVWLTAVHGVAELDTTDKLKWTLEINIVNQLHIHLKKKTPDL